jgi:hypothetical protein
VTTPDMADPQRGEFSAAVELRRRFPGITDNTQARECARTIPDGRRWRQRCRCRFHVVLVGHDNIPRFWNPEEQCWRPIVASRPDRHPPPAERVAAGEFRDEI